MRQKQRLLKTLRWAKNELEIRGLFSASLWICRLLASLEDLDEKIISSNDYQLNCVRLKDTTFTDKEQLAKSLFHARDFKHCNFVLQSSDSNYSDFLRLYSNFLLAEESEHSFSLDSKKSESNSNKKYGSILNELSLIESSKKMDPFIQYLYAVVLSRVGQKKKSVECLKLSIKKFPFNWSAWRVLSSTKTNCFDFDYCQEFCSHWMLFFFFPSLKMFRSENIKHQQSCIESLEKLFPENDVVTRIKLNMAYNERFFDIAQIGYEKLYNSNPFDVDSMDNYSNILFVKGCKKELGCLSRHFWSVCKYRPESAVITANYYSMCGDHLRAVEFFKRAIKLNPRYVNAWILLGHELVELGDLVGSKKAYNKALEINDRDFRALYGIGKIFEMMDSYKKALFYYQRATQFKQTDSRMWCAMANCYEKDGRVEDAIRCYLRVNDMGDEEGIAIVKLADFYSKIGDTDKALRFYREMVKNIGGIEPQINERLDPHSIKAILFLGGYEAKHGDPIKAEILLNRLLIYEGKEKDKAKELLNELVIKKGKRSLDKTDISDVSLVTKTLKFE